MARIQEIAEELVNLTVQEVNELSFVLKNGLDNPVCAKIDYRDYITTPKEYGMNLQKIKKYKNYNKKL